MSKKTAAFVLLISAISWQSIVAQKSVSPESAIAARGQIPFQRFKTDGKDIFIVRIVRKKDAELVRVKRTRLVPEKTPTGIKYRKVTETILTPAMEEKLVPIDRQYVFQNIKGKKISKTEMIGQLGMGHGKLIVSLMPGQSIPKAWTELLAKDVVLYSIDPTMKE